MRLSGPWTVWQVAWSDLSCTQDWFRVPPDPARIPHQLGQHGTALRNMCVSVNGSWGPCDHDGSHSSRKLSWSIGGPSGRICRCPCMAAGHWGLGLDSPIGTSRACPGGRPWFVSQVISPWPSAAREPCRARRACPLGPVGPRTVGHEVHGPVQPCDNWHDLNSAFGDKADRQPTEAAETRRTMPPSHAPQLVALQRSRIKAHPKVMQLRSLDPLVRRRPPVRAPPEFTHHADNSRLFSTIFRRSDLLGDIDGNGLSLSG